ncbi:MAG: CvpA family protein [Dehalococcoidia bacterium]
MDFTSAFGIVTDIIVALALIFSFIGGLRQGAVREIFGLAAFIIALVLTGLFIGYVAGWLSFISILTWRNFVAFLLTMSLILVVLYLILWIPRYFIAKVWDGGFVWSLVGGIFGLIDAALGLILLVKLLNIYPILSWLNSILASSHVLNWLVANFGGFITVLLQSTTGRAV